ncbi:cytochrome P450 [Aspergillus californicus]
MLHHTVLLQDMSLSWAHLNTLFAAILAFLVLRALYLLYFHPLASFPGPRLAALSTWWLFSVSKTGRAELVFEDLHRKYNTRALRISPNEIHISDSSLYHTIYSQDHIYTKHPYFYAGFGTPHSVFVETDKTLHQQRRRKMNRFFSKGSIRGMQRMLYAKVERLCTVITELSERGPLNIYSAVRCMTVDIISDLGFGQSFKLMDDVKGAGFEAPFLQAFDLAAASIWDLMFFPILRFLVFALPPSMTVLMGGPAAHMARLFQSIQSTVSSFKAAKASGRPLDHDVIFDGLSDLNHRELVAEAADVLVAVSDTTATTLTVAVHQLVRNPEAYETLKREVRQANLTTREDFDLKSIEQLPYLSACVKESLRVANPVPGRLPRIVPKPKTGAAPLTVDGKVIPAGTIVGISAYTIHCDPEIWGPDAMKFIPERWLQPEGKQLDKYLVTFSKGARQCLGIK